MEEKCSVTKFRYEKTSFYSIPGKKKGLYTQNKELFPRNIGCNLAKGGLNFR